MGVAGAADVGGREEGKYIFSRFGESPEGEPVGVCGGDVLDGGGGVLARGASGVPQELDGWREGRDANGFFGEAEDPFLEGKFAVAGAHCDGGGGEG